MKGGFRIAWEGKDLIFVSKSGAFNTSSITINNRNGYGQTEPAAGIWYFSGSDSKLGGLEATINNNISEYFTASVDTASNTVHLTMSLDYRAVNPKIYTGSLTDFINVDGYPGPRGGEFLTELSGGYDPDTGITKIVVKGQEILTGSNLYLHAHHGYMELPPVDHYGIDRKDQLNVRLDPLNDRIISHSYRSPITTGKRYVDYSLICKLNSAHDTPRFDVLNQAYKEAVDAGIIYVTSAGNNSFQSTVKSSSVEENPYFDAELYDDDLYNTYFEIDYNYSVNSLAQNQGPNTPMRLFGTSIANDSHIINVGLFKHPPTFPLPSLFI